MSFGKNLRHLREQHGIERKVLAQIFDMPYNTLKNYENDEREPGHRFIIKAAQYFGVSADYLLDNDLTTLFKDDIPVKQHENLSEEAVNIAYAYDRADLGTKSSVRKLLDLPPIKSKSTEQESKLNQKNAI